MGTPRPSCVRTGLAVIRAAGILGFPREAAYNSGMTARSRFPQMALATSVALALTACDGNSSNDTPRPAQQPPTGWRTYGDTKLGFSIAYPEKWRVDLTHVYPTPIDDARLVGVAFIIPSKLAAHTNLSTDTYLSVESVPSASSCKASAFLSTTDTERDEDQRTLHWSVATAGDAGASNFYDETVYALKDSHPCLGIRYFIHSTNVDNYPAGTIRQFDKAGLVRWLDRIRSTFALTPHQRAS